MKTIYNQNILKTLALAACMLLAFLPQAQAQYASQRKVHFAVDWQMNAPLATDFTDKISGWGMNFEGVYDVTSHFSAGAFLSFHTNHSYVKLGAMFGRYTTYFGTGGLYDTSWGFYASPEVGLKIYPNLQKNWGFHIAGYYSYATNRAETLTVDIEGQNNVGFRLGVLF